MDGPCSRRGGTSTDSATSSLQARRYRACEADHLKYTNSIDRAGSISLPLGPTINDVCSVFSSTICLLIDLSFDAAPHRLANRLCLRLAEVPEGWVVSVAAVAVAQ
jgi:hypothetical protein